MVLVSWIRRSLLTLILLLFLKKGREKHCFESFICLFPHGQYRQKILYSSKDVSNFLNNDIKDGEYLMIKGSNSTGLNTMTKKLKSGKINAI